MLINHFNSHAGRETSICLETEYRLRKVRIYVRHPEVGDIFEGALPCTIKCQPGLPYTVVLDRFGQEEKCVFTLKSGIYRKAQVTLKVLVSEDILYCNQYAITYS